MNTLIAAETAKRKWQFKTRTLFFAVTFVAILMASIGQLNRLQLWWNTIFYCDRNEIVELPLGETFRTNQWSYASKSLSLGLLFTGTPNEFLLIQNGDGSNVATMIVDGERFVVIVTDSRFHGPAYSAELRIRPGKKKGP
jgi:hypothetical protein